MKLFVDSAKNNKKKYKQHPPPQNSGKSLQTPAARGGRAWPQAGKEGYPEPRAKQD